VLDTLLPVQEGFFSIEGIAGMGFAQPRYVHPDASAVELPQSSGFDRTFAAAVHPVQGLATLESGRGEEGGALVLRAFAVGGRERFAPVQVTQLPAQPFGLQALVGLDAQGRLLVLWDDGTGEEPETLRARWYSAEGAPLTAEFDAGVSLRRAFDGSFVRPGPLAALKGGGLVLRVEGRWTRLFPAAVARAEPAPAWLAARPFTTLAPVRGGRAYALLQDPESGEYGRCRDALELVTPAGESCGTLRFASEGGACGDPLVLGADGSVLQQRECRAQVWRALLR
jgi:hypothetical protein